MKIITADELKELNGKEGKPVYIAHEGDVYDVSESKLWKGGIHMLRHHAGADLTNDVKAAPHSPEVLQRYKKVAELYKEATPERRLPPLLSGLLKRYPFLRRHPHPMTVHFPIVFMVSAPLFAFIYLVTGVESFESTALNCLGAGLLFAPLVVATGYYTWWLNYWARPMRPVTVKKRCSLLLLITGIIAFSWRITTPDILSRFRTASIVYLFLLCSLFALVAVIGWFGATLTFPLDKE
jgi:predicted heme/steroid binding protein/uncharacterized membrane protein